jgi:ABC-type Zn2+ transport system substrate-binding protein/surface adhesin
VQQIIDLLEFTKCNPRAYQIEIQALAKTVLLEYEEALQQQRAAEEQQAAADRHKHEQMGRVMNAAQDNHEHEHSQRPQGAGPGS